MHDRNDNDASGNTSSRVPQRPLEDQLRQLTETISASEARLQLALEVGGMGAWQADLRTGEIMWWPGMELVLGLPAGTPAMPMERYYTLVHPDDRATLKSVIDDALERASGHRVEYRVIWPDGSVHWLEGRGKIFLDEHGKARIMAGMCLDITRRKSVENDLIFLAGASAELARLDDYQTTLDKIAHLAVPHFADWCAIDMLEEDGSLKRLAVAHVDPAKVHIAHALYRRFPPNPKAATGTWNVLRTGEPELFSEITEEMFERGIRHPEYRAALQALGLRSYLAVPVTVRGHTLGVISFVTAESRRLYNEGDVALAADLAGRAGVAIENAKLMRALQDSDRKKDVFLATLAHELRNPLAPIRNGLSIIKMDPADRPRVEHVVEIAQRQVGQLSRLVDDLLDVSRISTGKIELKKEHTDLVSILENAIETSRPHIEAARHSLSVVYPQEPTDLVADPLRLAQVFANLLNNASKYTPPGGEIRVAAQALPDSLVVKIRDSGTGIAPAMLKKVFSLFTQAIHPMERRQGGLGIGLSLVDGLVRLHGGTVKAHSEGLGKGSEFVVTLPRVRPVKAAEAGVPAADAAPLVPAARAVPAHDGPRTARRILVVDDNVDAAGTVAELLEMLGNEVATVHEGAGAVAQVAQFRPDVVLLDIGLPDLNGYEVARRIRKLKGVRQPVLIALTGWGQKSDKLMAQQAGFDRHWTKPVDAKRLQEL